MTLKKQVVQIAGIAIALIAIPAFAESAPVYDADDIQHQLESAVEPEQDLPPPPPPGQDNVFMPNRSSNNAVNIQNYTAPSNPTGNMTIDQRVKRVEQQVTAIQSTNSSAKVESLQSEIQALRGQVEQLTHQLQQLQTQQKSFYSDVDKRLTQNQDVSTEKLPDSKSDKAVADAVATAAAPAPKAAKPDSTEQPNVAEEQQIYQSAYTLIKAKKYDAAIKVLQDMLVKYPSGQFASNAHYWLGELYGLLGKNNEALNEFSIVVQRYPDSPRVSDAQLKIGLLYATQTKWSEARAAFKKVINRYPGTASSRLASEQLKQIKNAGH